MELQVCKLEEPIKLCVICQKAEPDCLRDGPHIFDCISYTWAVVDMLAERPISFHISSKEAGIALARYNRG